MYFELRMSNFGVTKPLLGGFKVYGSRVDFVALKTVNPIL
jgi:hypothetical protein